MRALSVIFVFVAFSAIVFAEKNVRFVCPQANGYYADPNNCIYYWHCRHNEPTRVLCPKAGLVQLQFDTVIADCRHPDDVACGSRPICDENDENCDGSSTCENDSMPDGSICHAGSTERQADKNHCSMYWECVSECPMKRSCPANYLYSTFRGYCDPANVVFCDKRDCDGLPCLDNDGGVHNFDCPAPYGYFADPADCKNYWICDSNAATRYTCGKQMGQQLFYNDTAQACDYPDRVNCGDRPICDDQGENCHSQPSTTARPATPCENISCSDNLEFHPQGPCERCFCHCAFNVDYEQCCDTGLVYNANIHMCDWPFNVPGCT